MKVNLHIPGPVSQVTLHIGDMLVDRATCIIWTMSYGDPLAIQYLGLTTEYLTPPSNFCHFDAWCEKGDWGAVTNFWKGVDYQFLMDVQPRDGAELSKKMNWLVNHGETSLPSRPLWYKNGILHCGHSVFGHQPVMVEADDNGEPIVYEYFITYPEDRAHPRWIPFYNAMGMPKSMLPVIRAEMAQGIDPHDKYPYWIQRCSGAKWNGTKDVIDWYPLYNGIPDSGKINYVFWSKEDWPHNTGDNRMLLPVECTTRTPP